MIYNLFKNILVRFFFVYLMIDCSNGLFITLFISDFTHSFMINANGVKSDPESIFSINLKLDVIFKYYKPV